MSSGYVLDFTDRDFAIFFRQVAKVNIDDGKYKVWGNSKARRLRAFWEQEPDQVVGLVLKEMLAVWLHNSKDSNASQDKNYISAHKAVERILGIKPKADVSEAEFLEKKFGEISLKKLRIESSLMPILESRLVEINNCLQKSSPLAAVILAGSILEGILLGAALNEPQKFNQAASSPKDKSGKVLPFQNWTLGYFIDVAYQIGYLKIDVKKFSHSLRDFRNYIHPYEQMASNFNPDQHTARICLQVLKAVVADLSGER